MIDWILGGELSFNSWFLTLIVLGLGVCVHAAQTSSRAYIVALSRKKLNLHNEIDINMAIGLPLLSVNVMLVLICGDRTRVAYMYEEYLLIRP